MRKNNQTVYIIDDDVHVCDALRWLFESVNFQVETYESGHLFLKNYKQDRAGCLIIDVRMPGMSGLELLEQLNLQKNRLPVIVMTGHGDIMMAVRAMKAGAKDFISKPICDQYLLDIVNSQIDVSINGLLVNDIDKRFKRLSDRESQVIKLLLDGKLNKEIAHELSISMSTVEAHRANIMQKTQAKNLAELIKLYFQSQFNVDMLPGF